MLQAGRAFEVRAWLVGPDEEALVGRGRARWLKAEANAACGDYPGADAALDNMSEEMRRVRLPPNLVVPVRTAIAFRVGMAMLSPSPLATSPADRASALYFPKEALGGLAAPVVLLRQEADFRVLRGLLALEAGDMENAHRQFGTALSVWQSDLAAQTGAGLDFPSRGIAQLMMRRLQEKE